MIRSVFLFVFAFSIAACNENRTITDAQPEETSMRTEITLLAGEIAADNYIGTAQVSRNQQTSPAYLRRQKLMDIATDDELLTLTGDPNAVVNLVAFEGLYNRSNSVVPEIFKGFMEREKLIDYLRGDIMQRMPMLEYAYVYVMQYTMPDEGTPSGITEEDPKFEFDKKKREEIELRILDLREE